ncbi:MAG: hypothetical protein ACXWHZ_03630 [Usitatibacter sp.]
MIVALQLYAALMLLAALLSIRCGAQIARHHVAARVRCELACDELRRELRLTLNVLRDLVAATENPPGPVADGILQGQVKRAKHLLDPRRAYIKRAER